MLGGKEEEEEPILQPIQKVAGFAYSTTLHELRVLNKNILLTE